MAGSSNNFRVFITNSGIGATTIAGIQTQGPDYGVSISEDITTRNVSAVSVTANALSGPLTGNVTGNLTGVASGNKLLAAFDIQHVKDEGKRIRHICAEGPEAGIYVRGKLVNSNKIELPEYWNGLIDPETITVTLTQIGYSQDLIVEGIEWGKVVKIKSGSGTAINCYYEIWAARWIDPKDHDKKLHVVYEGEGPKDYPGDNGDFVVGGVEIPFN